MLNTMFNTIDIYFVKNALTFPHFLELNHRFVWFVSDWREFAAGYGAGVMNIMVTFPINKTMFR
jgi:hypothetical protein